ncbi:hypothetical protein BDV59DRAFT_193433 [Aspergillus ambiguus]|uniref:uncharacterized protein n=1 Tax=Aspergillus ambiguus TaxID=176160 RepID=UPI003CCDA94E
MATAARPRTPDLAAADASNGSGNNRRTSSSLAFLRRSKSGEPLGDRKSSGSKSKKKQAIEEELRRQREAAMPKHPPRLPDLSPTPVLETFGGDERLDSVAALSSPSHHARPIPSRSAMSTPNTNDYDPYARTESMTHRGRFSYASSAVSTVNNPRRLRRRKDPTPYNILVIGARNSGKTSFLNFLRSSLALPPHKHPSRAPEEVEFYDRQSPANEGYTSHYLETEIDGERVGLTLWDSQGFERNIVDIQLRGVTGFLESKFEETLNEEMKVIRSPGVRDTHIHCTFLVLDPVRLDENIAAADRAAQGTPKASDSPVIGILDESLDLQVLRTVLGKTTVVPVISKADTITTAHMAYLRKAVWDSLRKANIDPLEILTLEEQEDEYASTDEEAAAEAEAEAEGEKPDNLPFSILSPDPHSLAAGDEPVGRKFPWGFADPYNPEHCDFLKLKDSVFSDWRSELREASRVIWYERWRTSRLNRQGPAAEPPKKVYSCQGPPACLGGAGGALLYHLSFDITVTSPSGHTRQRSRSRDPLAPSAAVEASRQATRSYLAPDHADPYARSRSRSRSRSRAASPRRTYRVDDDLSASDSDHDRYYLSDSGRKATRHPRERRSADLRSPSLRPTRYDVPSDDSLSASEDEALAYGDIPSDLEREYYGYKASPRTSASRVDSHPSYARPGSFQYATPSQYLQGQKQPQQPAYSGPPPTSAPPSAWAPIPECERPGYVPPSSQPETMPGAFPASTLPDTTAASGAPVYATAPYVTADGQPSPYASWGAHRYQVPTSGAYVPPGTTMASAHQRTVSSDPPGHIAYATPPAFQYAQIDPKVKYAPKPTAKPAYAATPAHARTGSEPQAPYDLKYSATPQFASKPATTRPQESGPHYVEITPGGRSGRPHSLSMSAANTLSVEAPDPSFRPVSPMLEPYKGTYQSISPMPSPIVGPARLDEDLSELEPLDASDSEGSRRRKHRRKKSKDPEKKSDRTRRDSSRVRHDRHSSSSSLSQIPGPESLMVITPGGSGGGARKRVSFYDPTPDATAMQEALSHTRSVDHKTLIRVLPHLSSDEMLDLRKEYKHHVKLRGKGINLAKHLRVKLGNNAFGKVCYATALGRWESEAFWANCYYQSSTSRRELLIEALFGRTREEIREIKACFRDSRYLDSLEKCMRAELKADKFRTAVMLALEEEARPSERDPVDEALVQRDVHELHRALVARHGGETAMIYIIVRRSDAHLREVLRAYEAIYQRNFARAMIAKSQNLVGETLAHILNGVINRPMRDALLLHQALRESKSGKERSELLISRLVRFHWEPRHLEQVKLEFRRRYKQRLEEAIAEEILPIPGGSEWGEFCIELAQSSKRT